MEEWVDENISIDDGEDDNRSHMSQLTNASRAQQSFASSISSKSTNSKKWKDCDKEPPFLWDNPLTGKLLTCIEEEFAANGGTDGGGFKTPGWKRERIYKDWRGALYKPKRWCKANANYLKKNKDSAEAELYATNPCLAQRKAMTENYLDV